MPSKIRSLEGVLIRMRLSFLRILITVMALAAPSFAGSADLPNQGLEDRIQFWTKVYTQYGEDDVIIHDRIYVNLIYDVADRGESTGKVTAVRRALDEINANLANPEEQLSPVAQQVKDAITAYGLAVTPATLAALRDNVHTQLGIRERF